ncbi:hypothetical protein ABT075_19265 [Streptomyces sp. NPDC002677]|uniref:hypothetical protein n=1 Tax=Streptomyces sp. NPDC002677 TaxID=3154774 RepID=UPI00331900ED
MSPDPPPSGAARRRGHLTSMFTAFSVPNFRRYVAGQSGPGQPASRDRGVAGARTR